MQTPSTKVIGLAGLGLLVVILIGSYFSFSNTAVRLETTVKTQWRENQNAYDTMWKTITETAQIPEKYKSDFKELLVADTTGKYGENGASQVMLWANDRNIQLPQEAYTNLQRIIESQRAEFRDQQTALNDKIQRLDVHLHATTSGRMWGMLTNYPSVIQGQYAPPFDTDGDGILTALDYPVVTSERTEETFRTAKDEPLDVFGKS